MKKSILTVLTFLIACLSSNVLFAQTTTTAPAKGSSDLVTTLSTNSDYNVTAVLIRAAGLAPALKGAGPFTILAPSNTAFSIFSSGKLDSLVADPVKLAAVLKGHALSGTYDKAALIKILDSGKQTLTTLDGKPLTLSVTDKHLTFTDSEGNKAKVIAFDILGSNGVVIGIDAVLAK